jgi:hypothetical protein
MKALPNRRPPGGEGGQTLVEYALVLPVLLLLLLGIMDFGIVVFKYNTIANAAREGARFGIVRAGDAGLIEDHVLARTVWLGNPEDFTVTATFDIAVNTVTVQIDYDAQLITGYVIEALGGRSFVPLSTRATMQLE